MDSIWFLVALTALISSARAGGNTFVPGPMESLFEDTEFDPRNPLSPPQCVFTWIDVLKVFNPLNQRGDCKLNCADNEDKKRYTIEWISGAQEVCCCLLTTVSSIEFPAVQIPPPQRAANDSVYAPTCQYSPLDKIMRKINVFKMT